MSELDLERLRTFGGVIVFEALGRELSAAVGSIDADDIITVEIHDDDIDDKYHGVHHVRPADVQDVMYDNE